MGIDKQKLFTTINELVEEELKVVSFKWLARQYSLPANAAKKVLSEFLEKNQGRVSATYLISGWTKGPEPEHSIQLVDSGSLIERRKTLDPITSLHVYSVQPTQPKDASELWNTDNLQTLEFFTSLVKGGSDNCLADNRWSAVQCQQAKHDPSLSTAKALGARKAADAAKEPAAPANGGVVAAIKKAAAGKEAGKGTEAAKDKGSGPAAAAAPSTAPKPAAAPAVASGPATNQAKGPAKAAGGAGKKGAALSAMWNKAPPKKASVAAAAAKSTAAGKAKAAARPAEAKQNSTVAVDAEAALRLNEEAESSSESEEEQAPIQRSNPGRRAHVLHDDEDESGPDSPAQPASKRPRSGNAPARKNTTVLNESDDDSDWEAPKRGAGRGTAAAKQNGVTAAPKAAVVESEEEEGASQKGKAAKPAAQKKTGAKAAAAKRPSPGTIKDHGEAAGGPKRRKVLRTTYNDKGEEVTEMVYEDEPAPEPAQPAVQPQEQEKEDVPAAAAAKAAQLKAATPAEPAAAQAAKASSQSQGSAGAPPPKKEPAKAGAKKGGAKVLPGQRGIKSFFAKK